MIDNRERVSQYTTINAVCFIIRMYTQGKYCSRKMVDVLPALSEGTEIGVYEV